jgi:predicted nucleic acid-binding protein
VLRAFMLSALLDDGWACSFRSDWRIAERPRRLRSTDRSALLSCCWQSSLSRVPDPIPTVDGLLAATAVHHDLVLATRNVKDVARTGVQLVNPFDDPAP